MEAVHRLGQFIEFFKKALRSNNIELVAQLLHCFVRDEWARADAAAKDWSEVQDICSRLPTPWDEAIFAHVNVMLAVQRKEYVEAYNHQSTLVHALLRAMVDHDRSSLPILKTVLKDLRVLAGLGDHELEQDGSKPDRLSDAARVLNKAFQLCITDRSSISTSKKWGAFLVVNHLFKVYFRLRQLRLCTNLIRAIHVGNLPDLGKFPASQNVTYKYYIGLLAFYDEDYTKAYQELSSSLHRCFRQSKHNKRLLLSFIVPLRVLHGSMVRTELLSRYGLQAYASIIKAVRMGNIAQFDKMLGSLETVLMRRHVYLVFERLKLILYRNLLKKTFIILNKNPKLHLQLLLKAFEFSGAKDTSIDSLECILSILIDKGYVKGYISHEKSFLVVSQQSAFPPISQVQQ